MGNGTAGCPPLTLPQLKEMVAAFVTATGAPLDEVDTAALAAELYPFHTRTDVDRLWALILERAEFLV